MHDHRYNAAMQAARQILDRLSGPPEPDYRHRLPEVACYVLGAINRVESGQAEQPPCPRTRRKRRARRG
ncbi:hypothetical protein [Tautonia marina]|uniref:hypothetical protein n=1 Tax=Tautonia marina TaxID=2653855 RepID=UPI001260EBD8|nr:hypothetical protein [Tautonia marina]